jgi:hypothetical protein
MTTIEKDSPRQSGPVRGSPPRADVPFCYARQGDKDWLKGRSKSANPQLLYISALHTNDAQSTRLGLSGKSNSASPAKTTNTASMGFSRSKKTGRVFSVTKVMVRPGTRRPGPEHWSSDPGIILSEALILPQDTRMSRCMYSILFYLQVHTNELPVTLKKVVMKCSLHGTTKASCHIKTP